MASTHALIAACQREADGRLLRDVIAGRVDVTSPSIFARMELMLAAYDADREMTALRSKTLLTPTPPSALKSLAGLWLAV